MERPSIIRCVAALAAALVLASCTPKPKDYLEALNWGMDAQNKGDLKAAYANYRAAYEIADKVGNGSRAVHAADLAADAASALGKTDDAVKLLDAALRSYRKEASGYVGRFRMPNDLAVYKALQKKNAEAKRLLEEGLKPYEDKGSFSPAFPFGPFGTMSRNLARVLAAEEWNADTEVWYDYLTAKIIDNATLNHNSAYFWIGSGAALRALAVLAKTGPRAGEAVALEEKAAELEAAEAQFAGRVGTSERCYTRNLKTVKQTVCMLELP
jgi:tetratricopeptide (TPR) repeat protein